MMSLMRMIPFLLAAAAAFSAETTTPIDNAQVKVLKVTQDPHVKTGLHQHKINRVMIYLQAGRQNFDYPQEGKKLVVDWKPGEAKWSPAGGMHIAEITSDNPAPMHEHTLNRVVTYITDQKFRVTTPDGKVETIEHKAGDVSWGTPTKHKEENLSDKPFEVVVVELKS